MQPCHVESACVLPAWMPGTKLDALKKISGSLREWREHDHALSLLELGESSAIEPALQSLF